VLLGNPVPVLALMLMPPKKIPHADASFMQ
jgi:hypothetical protein